MATISNSNKDNLIIFDSSNENAPTSDPITGGPLTFGVWSYDINAKKAYAWNGSQWKEQ